MMANIGISVADIPNFAGNWTGVFEGDHNGMDSNAVYVNANQTGALGMAISEQKGRVFAGTFNENFNSNRSMISDSMP